MATDDFNNPDFPETPIYDRIDKDFGDVALRAYPELMELVGKLLTAGEPKDKILSAVEGSGATPSILLLVEKYIDQQVGG